MKKYGMKPQNKKKNIEILKSVYKFLKIKEINQPEQKEEANDVKPTKGRIFSYYQNRKILLIIQILKAIIQ